MKKIAALFMACILCMGMSVTAFAQEPAGAAQTPSGDVIEISTVEDLQAVNENLSGNYVLMNDIDLEGIAWTPLGAFSPAGEEEEEQEIPDPEVAFTGTFDGNGYTISNLVIDQPEGYALGLFGCIANADVGNFVLKDATSNGTFMVGNAIGYSFTSTVHDITVENGLVTVNRTEMSDEGMYASVVAACMDSVVLNCQATADIVIPDGVANAGIIGGGLEMTSVSGCKASGSITAGNNCFGIGGVTGCGFGSEYFTDCLASDVSITTGDDCYWIGGITGYAGGYEDESFGIPVTVFTNCDTEHVTITTGENADGVAEIVGSGFYLDEIAEMMGAPFDQPTVFELVDCEAR